MCWRLCGKVRSSPFTVADSTAIPFRSSRWLLPQNSRRLRASCGSGTNTCSPPASLPRGGAHPLELTRFLRVAIGLAAALGQVPGHGLIHKDIKPPNILVDDAGNVRLTGFGIASRLPQESQAPAPPEVIAGTLAYMAPEQTGRMNRSIDARSDLYSLGVTLYQMLTGTLPFAATDPLEW